MFNGPGEVGVEEADCAASVGQAVNRDRGGRQPTQDGRKREQRRGRKEEYSEEEQKRTDQPLCVLAGWHYKKQMVWV